MKTTQEIAEKLGCTMTTVRKTMEALGHKPDNTGRGFKYSSDAFDDIVEHYHKNAELTKRFVGSYKTKTAIDEIVDILKNGFATHNHHLMELNQRLDALIVLQGGEVKPDEPLSPKSLAKL